MKQALKKKWTSALRSGKYKQGAGFLKRKRLDNIEYCCLGVLCNLITNSNRYWKTSGESISHFYVIDSKNQNKIYSFIKRLLHIKTSTNGNPYTMNSCTFPSSILPHLELSKENIHHLIYMNDGKKLSFIEIADWIEENL